MAIQENDSELATLLACKMTNLEGHNGVALFEEQLQARPKFSS